MDRVGSILHGAYGDYYEQMVCLKHYRKCNPDVRLILFFASEHRRRELEVFDLSFADEVYSASALQEVPVDRFLQFQVQDPELREEVLANLPAPILSRFDLKRNLKPWSFLRKIDLRDPANDVGLSEEGQKRLPTCMSENGVDESLFRTKFTVGFLWRYRGPGGAISPFMQTSEDESLRSKREVLSELISRYRAHVLICGMNVKRTKENFYRIEAKYTEKGLGLGGEGVTYLQGLSWGLELEILRRCSLCIVMPSGFSEALWIKRTGPTLLVDPPLHYLAKLVWHRMPLFNTLRPTDIAFQLRQPHTATRVLRRLRAKGFLPPLATDGASS